MKHVLAVMMALCVGAGSAAAQGLQPGAKAGVTLARVTFDGDEGEAAFDTRVGLTGGVFVTWRAVSWLALQPELLVTSKGARFEADVLDTRLVLDYLEVPLLARLSRRVSGATVYAAAGPSFGWLLRAKSRVAFDGSTEEIDLKDEVEPFEIGAAFGGGIEIGAFVVDGRFTLGLSDIDADTTAAAGMKTRTIALTAGFRF